MCPSATLSNFFLFLCMILHTQPSYSHLIKHIRGSEGFIPCDYKTDPGDVQTSTLICDEEASKNFGDSLPIIQSDDIQISKITVVGNTKIIRCPSSAFAGVNPDRKSIGPYRALEAIDIRGTSLVKFEAGCFKGLTDLLALHIVNDRSNQTTVSAEDVNALFNELKHLSKLKELRLENWDLSGGIPRNAFGRWSQMIRKLQLINNRLTHIDDDAFPGRISNMIEELHLEQQTDGWKMLSNAPRWARNLRSLRYVSFMDTKMQSSTTTGAVTVDFGLPINQQLIALNLENCSITNLMGEKRDRPGLSIAPLARYLKELYLDYNHFPTNKPAEDGLDGLKSCSQLRLLSLDHNRNPLYTLPHWFSSTTAQSPEKLEELRLRDSGLVYLPANAFPASLRVLHLSANPLQYVDEGWIRNNTKLLELHLNYVRLGSVDISGYQGDWDRAFIPLAKSLQLISLIGCQITPLNLLDESILSERENSMDGHGNDTRNGLFRTTSPRLPRLKLGLERLSQLTTLVLNNNDLDSIPNGALSKLPRLKHLLLAGNHLKTVGEIKHDSGNLDHYSQTGRLQRLDLRFNQLTTLDRCASALGIDKPLEELLPKKSTWFAAETKYTVRTLDHSYKDRSQTGSKKQWFGGLSLAGNPLVCDCRLAWLRGYISDMENNFTNGTADKRTANEYDSYRKEALDFTCSNSGTWKGRKFLSLRPVDLYAVDHDDCQIRPEVYGSALNASLASCSRLLLSRKSNTSRFLKLASLGTMQLKSPPIHKLQLNKMETGRRQLSEPPPLPPLPPPLGLSTEALILVIVAATVSVCFVIISVIIIIWLCCRLKRNERLRKGVAYHKSDRHSRHPCGCLFQCGEVCGRPVRTCGFCSCCTSSHCRASRLTATSQYRLTPPSILGENRGYQAEITNRIIPLAHDDTNGSPNRWHQPDSAYPDWEIRSLARKKTEGGMTDRSHNKGDPIPKRSNRLWTPAQKRAHGDADRTLPHRASEATEGDSLLEPNLLSTAHSVNALDWENSGLRPACRTGALMDLPQPRKSKSSADVSKVFGPRVLRGYADTADIDSRHTGQLHVESLNILPSKCSPTSGTRFDSESDSSPHRPLPWRSKSAGSSRRKNKNSGNQKAVYQPTSQPFVRNRLTRSTGSVQHSSTTNQPSTEGWLRASRRRIRRGFNWIRRTFRKNGSEDKPPEELMAKVEPSDPAIEEQIEENMRTMQGPDLPLPPFVIPPENRPQVVRVTSTNDGYLPMNMNGDSAYDDELDESRPGERFTSNKDGDSDEYVKNIPLLEPDISQVPTLRQPKLQRKPSRSAGDTMDSIRHPQVRLSGNPYSMGFYDEPSEVLNIPQRHKMLVDQDLPPPPPPPPKFLVSRPVVWADPQRDNYILHNTTEKPPTPVKNSERQPAPPVGPKPRHLNKYMKTSASSEQNQPKSAAAATTVDGITKNPAGTQ